MDALLASTDPLPKLALMLPAEKGQIALVPPAAPLGHLPLGDAGAGQHAADEFDVHGWFRLDGLTPT
jgi:hypothetical protein